MVSLMDNIMVVELPKKLQVKSRIWSGGIGRSTQCQLALNLLMVAEFKQYLLYGQRVQKNHLNINVMPMVIFSYVLNSNQNSSKSTDSFMFLYLVCLKKSYSPALILLFFWWSHRHHSLPCTLCRHHVPNQHLPN
ncbi:MAG: hypothetical protein ACJAZP_001739 [Psychromonas sp.]|jgi:hypothetical protein